MSEQSRIAALRAAVEIRKAGTTPAEIKIVAQEFDDWLTRRIGPPTTADESRGPRPGNRPSR